MIWAGVDPGLNGGVAVIDEMPDLETATLRCSMVNGKKYLDGAWLATWLAERHVTHAIVEQVWAHPGEGQGRSWAFATAFGQILAVMQTNGVTWHLVPAVRWKRAYGLLGAGKDAARILARGRWPQFAETEFRRKMDIHRAEAALLADYGRLQGHIDGR